MQNIQLKRDLMMRLCGGHSFETFGAGSFMPIQRVKSLFIPAYDKVDGDMAMFVLPISSVCVSSFTDLF